MRVVLAERMNVVVRRLRGLSSSTPCLVRHRIADLGLFTVAQILSAGKHLFVFCSPVVNLPRRPDASPPCPLAGVAFRFEFRVWADSGNRSNAHSDSVLIPGKRGFARGSSASEATTVVAATAELRTLGACSSNAKFWTFYQHVDTTGYANCTLPSENRLLGQTPSGLTPRHSAAL